MRGSELRKIRRGLGWTQKRMAKELRMGRNTIIRYEKGLRRIPYIMALAVRCLAFHRPPPE